MLSTLVYIVACVLAAAWVLGMLYICVSFLYTFYAFLIKKDHRKQVFELSDTSTDYAALSSSNVHEQAYIKCVEGSSDTISVARRWNTFEYDTFTDDREFLR